MTMRRLKVVVPIAMGRSVKLKIGMYVVGKHGNVLKFALVQYIIKVKTVALLEDIVVDTTTK